MSEFSQRSSILAHAVYVSVFLMFSSITGGSAVAQKSTERQRPIKVTSTTLNLRDFGATGDGIGDDGPALQQALTVLAASGGGTLLVPSGNYVLKTAVAQDFPSDCNVIISGEPSATEITVTGNGVGLDLTSQFIVAVGETNDALSLSGSESLLIKDIGFVGVQETVTDARVILSLENVPQATIQHSEFYGLASIVPGGAIVLAQGTDLRLHETAFLGCAANSGLTTSIVQNYNWQAIDISDCKFIDYGNRPDFFSKTPQQSPYSWINIGNPANPVPNHSRREAIIKHVFLDEGGYFAITARPDLAPVPINPFEVYLSRLNVNVTNLASDGVMIRGARKVFIDRSHFGWSHNAGFAVNLNGVGEAILDSIDCAADATRFNVNADRLAVINSNNTSLNSTAPFTRIITTETPDGDPAQYVRQQFLLMSGTDPDPAAHFYWTDRFLRCDKEAACVSQTRDALLAFLSAAPADRFSLTGQVIDQDGAPLPNVEVTLGGSQSVTMTTDNIGNFAFADLATSGAYEVSGAKSHYSFDNREIVTPTSDQVISLSGTLARHAITGRVFANTGRPLPDATVTLSGTQEAVTTSDVDGNYAFPDLSAGGNYVVMVSKENYLFADAERSLADLSANVFVVFEGALSQYRISGRLTDADGAPLAGVSVSLGGPQTGTQFTNATGDYLFTVFAGDDYTITPSDSHFAFTPSVALINDITADQVANFTGSLNKLTIGGRVFAHTGRVLSGATVTLTGPQKQTAISNDQGDFVFADLNAGGNYLISVSRNNYVFNVASYSFSDLISDQYVAFEGVLQNYTIAGNVKKEDGTPFVGTVVRLSGGLGATTVADDNGNYSFTVHGEDNYTVSAFVPDYWFTPATHSFAKISANQTADFVGELSGFIVSGSVVTPEGVRLGGVTISVEGSENDSLVTNYSDNFALNLQPQGDYTITPAKPNYTFSPASITINDLASNHQFNFVATINPGVPLMMSGADPRRALAVDAVLQTVGPFQMEYSYPWTSDRRTRVMLFVRNFDLPASEGANNISVMAEDSTHQQYPLSIEWAGKVDGSDWLIGIVVRLREELTDAGDVMVRVTHNGLTSDPLLFAIGHSDSVATPAAAPK